jgi:hypothetical protein
VRTCVHACVRACVHALFDLPPILPNANYAGALQHRWSSGSRKRAERRSRAGRTRQSSDRGALPRYTRNAITQ